MGVKGKAMKIIFLPLLALLALSGCSNVKPVSLDRNYTSSNMYKGKCAEYVELNKDLTSVCRPAMVRKETSNGQVQYYFSGQNGTVFIARKSKKTSDEDGSEYKIEGLVFFNRLNPATGYCHEKTNGEGDVSLSCNARLVAENDFKVKFSGKI
jgi:uncharacterized protein YceK